MQNWHKTLLWGTAWSVAAAGFLPSPDRTPTYSQDIYPVMKAKCMPCHESGRVGPFPLDTYATVRRNLKLVEQQVLSQNMPPYQIESELGPIGCSQPFTAEEFKTFQAWILAGAPEGRPIAPSAQARSAGDFVRMAGAVSQSVRAEGAPYWLIHEVAIPLDMEITGFDFVPASPGVLRTAVLGTVKGTAGRSTAAFEAAGQIGLSGDHILGAWSDGMPAFRLPSDTSITLKRGESLRVLALYQPDGRPRDAGFEVRFYTCSQPLRRTVKVRTFADDRFVIRAGDSPTFTLGKTLQEPMQIFAILPEARFYCTTFEATASASGKRTVLFATNRWNPYWVGHFELPSHPQFSKGTTLAFRFTYNNDERCTLNLNQAPREVRPGPGIEDEACAVHLLTLVDRR